MPVPVHQLAETEAVPRACSTATRRSSPPGERFAYSNGGYVVLALLAERAAGTPFHDLVQQRVFDPAGHGRSGVPAQRRAARRRRHRLPVRRRAADQRRCTCRCAAPATAAPSSAVADVDAFWRALFAGRDRARSRGWPRWSGRAARPTSGADAVRPRLLAVASPTGRCSWRATTPACRSARSTTRRRGRTRTVVSNWSDGAWPMCKLLGDHGL